MIIIDIYVLRAGITCCCSPRICLPLRVYQTSFLLVVHTTFFLWVLLYTLQNSKNNKINKLKFNCAIPWRTFHFKNQTVILFLKSKSTFKNILKNKLLFTTAQETQKVFFWPENAIGILCFARDEKICIWYISRFMRTLNW